jgi:DNA-binding SARP family transcriptional activator
MEFRLLGAVEVHAGGRRLELGPRRQRFVLAALALSVGHVVPVDHLVRLAWAEPPPRTARHAVQVAVSRLRAALAGADAGAAGVALLTCGAGYVLDAEPGRVDAYAFRALVRQARSAGDDRQRIAVLDRALGLWRGPALSGTGSGRDDLGGGLEEERVAAAAERVAAGLRLGLHAEFVADAVDLAGRFPLHERLVGQCMTALYRAGRAGDALLVYQRTRGRLARELGLDPGRDLRRLELAILRSDPIIDPVPAWLPAAR